MGKFTGWKVFEIIEYIDDFIIDCEETKASLKNTKYIEDIDFVIAVYTKMKQMLLEAYDILDTVEE